ncbi:secretion protein [Puteibacter caeruleilacunae]|nr:secretion protein [Puteibacter caeruleilacunae]
MRLKFIVLGIASLGLMSMTQDRVVVKKYKTTEVQIPAASSEKSGNWENFPFPKINFTNESLEGNGAYYKELIPDPEKFIQEACLEVCQCLYEDVSKIHLVKEIDYKVYDYKGVSAKSGHGEHVSIAFSSSYLAEVKKKMSEQQIIDEIKGVLVHELTHAYQLEPKGIGSYSTNKTFWSLIEGEADAVRIRLGYTPYEQRKVGGSWMDGYKTTGFFINWLATKEDDFIKKINHSCIILDKWGWNEMTMLYFNKGIDELWEEYQTFLKKGQS